MPSTLKQNLRNILVNRLINFLPHLSAKQVDDIIKASEKVVPKESKIILKRTRQLLQNNPRVLDFAKQAIRRLNHNCRKKIVENFILRGITDNFKTREESAKQGDAPLFTVLISPTMRCNLKCPGCYAKNYSIKNDLPFADFDRVVAQGKEMGVALFTILGGEPFIYPRLMDIFEKHSDAYFQVFTNAALLTEELCKKISMLGNVFCNISVEGLEATNDARRGQGSFAKSMKAMDNLSSYGAPFGYSVCATSKNLEQSVSDGFLDLMLKKGSMLAWYFLYMPVCGDKNTALMPSPDQRLFLKSKINEIRCKKPIMAVDFWNDAPLVKGCIAARQYCHINSNGDIEPCIFTHFSQANIKKTSLRQGLNYPFYKELRKLQPYNKNLLLPCMLIDNPEVFRRLHKKYSDLKQTHPFAKTLLNDLAPEINDYSKKIKKLYKKVWQEEKNMPIWQKH